ncbi:hypothetical protein D6817_02860 [Candidatus Pacearchaeota archaeon]|nr:MAG: hypothetical protein D6817_02860 [Candidatus Pacearchaeota archaeon]
MRAKEKVRREAEKRIEEFFSRSDWEPREAKKIKRLAMRFNIKLGERRKLFCKKCFARLRGKVRVRKGFKSVVCENCGSVARWRVK